MRIGVYSPNWIGDSVIALPFIQTLKNQEQDAEIIIICNDWVSGVYENHSAVKDVIPFSKMSTMRKAEKYGINRRAGETNDALLARLNEAKANRELDVNWYHEL